jgi:hypothetical protein
MTLSLVSRCAYLTGGVQKTTPDVMDYSVPAGYRRRDFLPSARTAGPAI